MANKKSLLNILEEYNIDTTNEGEVIRAYCPFHNDTGRPNFTVYPETDSWYCFACKDNGNTIAFISKIEGISYSDAKKKLNGEKIELEELQEKIDGLGFFEEKIKMNDELNILVSKSIRKFLKEHPEKVYEIQVLMQVFDNTLLLPVYYNDMKNIFEKVTSDLKKLYN